MATATSLFASNSSFKPEFLHRDRGYRTPSPPRHFVEPISPTTTRFAGDVNHGFHSVKRRKLHSTDRNNYIDASKTSKPRLQSHRARQLPALQTAFHEYGVGDQSPLDVLTDVATSPTFNNTDLTPFASSHASRPSRVNGLGHATTKGRLHERGSKRTQSEIILPEQIPQPQHTSRPVTSHIQSPTWSPITPPYGAKSGQAVPTHNNIATSDAELLLSFARSTDARPASSYPSTTAKPLSTQTPRNFVEYNTEAGHSRRTQPQHFPVFTPPQLPDTPSGSAAEYLLSLKSQTGLDSMAQPFFQSNSANTTTFVKSEEQPKPKAHRGWPKGKPRGPRNSANKQTPKPVRKAADGSTTRRGKRGPRRSTGRPAAQATPSWSVEDIKRQSAPRRKSFNDDILSTRSKSLELDKRASSAPPMLSSRTDSTAQPVRRQRKPSKKQASATPQYVCAFCNSARDSSNHFHDLWICCNACKKWYHAICVGFENERKVREVDRYHCKSCEADHGKTTFVRKSNRAHASIDYAGLHEGKMRSATDVPEHHYIEPIKDGDFEFQPETFARMPPELVTAEFFERCSAMSEPILIPAALNKPVYTEAEVTKLEDAMDQDLQESSSAPQDDFTEDLEYDCILDLGQDKLGMVMPRGLTVRRAAELYGPEEKVDVIDVKNQEGEDKRWNMRQWADYYESTGEKPVRNVISLEVSQSRLGRLIRRPQVVRDLDLQDAVWPLEEQRRGIFPRVQFYCLMSVADCYTDFHIDFGGSSVYYHILKGRKTFFFIPPTPKHLKQYEEWCLSPNQSRIFLGNETKECYRVDLYPGDTMLIPSGWIHAVWTPEDSLVIGGNFLTRLHYGMQIQVNDIEKNTGVGRKFRYPHFQKVLWHTVLQYLETDPIPSTVATQLCAGDVFVREQPVYYDFDADKDDDEEFMLELPAELYNARYYAEAELGGLHDLLRYIHRTVMISLGRIPGISKTVQEAVVKSLPKGYGNHADLLKTFAMWICWKRGDEKLPSWAYPDVDLSLLEIASEKKLGAAPKKRQEREPNPNDRRSRRLSDKDSQIAPPGANGPSLTSTPDSSEAAQPEITTEQPAIGPPLAPAENPAEINKGCSHVDDAAQDNRFRQRFGVLDMTKTKSPSPPKVSEVAKSEPMENVTQHVQPMDSGEADEPPRYQPLDAGNATREGADQMQGIPVEGLKNHATSLGEQVSDILTSVPEDHTTPQGNFGQKHKDAEVAMPENASVAEVETPIINTIAPGTVTKSKACSDCRRSKRRCIHTEDGKIDPAKAQEMSLSRKPRTAKRPRSDETAQVDTSKRPKSGKVSNESGILSTPSAADFQENARPPTIVNASFFEPTNNVESKPVQNNAGASTTPSLSVFEEVRVPQVDHFRISNYKTAPLEPADLTQQQNGDDAPCKSSDLQTANESPAKAPGIPHLTQTGEQSNVQARSESTDSKYSNSRKSSDLLQPQTADSRLNSGSPPTSIVSEVDHANTSVGLKEPRDKTSPQTFRSSPRDRKQVERFSTAVFDKYGNPNEVTFPGTTVFQQPSLETTRQSPVQSATTPTPKRASRSVSKEVAGSERGISREAVDGSKALGMSAEKARRPSSSAGLTEEDEASLRLIRELQTEQFGLRNRRGGA